MPPKELVKAVSFAKGMDAGSDPKTSERPILIQNMYPVHRNEMFPRVGTVEVSDDEEDQANIFIHEDKLYMGGDVLKVSDGDNEGVSIGDLNLFDIDVEELNVDNQAITGIEMCQNDNYRVIAFTFNNTLTLKAYDRSDGSLVDSDTYTGGANNNVVRVICVQDQLTYVYRAGSSALRWGFFNEATKSFTVSAALASSTAFSSPLLFVVDLGGGHLMTAAADSATTTEMLAFNSANGGLLGTYPIAVGGNTQPIGLTPMTNPAGGGHAVVVVRDTGSKAVTAIGYNVTDGNSMTFQTLWTPPGTEEAVSAVGLQTSDTIMSIFFSYRDTGAQQLGGLSSTETVERDYITTWVGSPFATSMGTFRNSVNGCSPITPPFFAGPSGRWIYPITVNAWSTLDLGPLANILWDGTNNLSSIKAQPSRGKFLAGSAWLGDAAIGHPREISRVTTEGENHIFACLYLKNANNTTAGAKLVTVTQQTSFKPVLSEKGIRIPSALPYYTDGQDIVEDAWPIIPPKPKATDAGSGGSIAAGTYYYRILWKATDADGRVFRSAMSQATKFVNPGTRKVDIEVNACAVSNRDYVEWELYRTEADGGVWLFLTGGTAQTRLYNLAATYTDLLADASLASAIYTTGGVLDNDPPEGHRVAALHHGRYCYAPRSRESTVVRYGKQSGFNDPLNHSAFLEIPIDGEGGRITALQSHRGRLIIFKERRIYVASGVERDNTGQGYGYRPAELLSGAIGTDNEKTVVATDVGVFFKGTNDIIYLITPSFKVNRVIGERMMYYTANSGTVKAAAIWETVGAAVFVTSHAMLLYFWEHDSWVLWTLPGVDIVYGSTKEHPNEQLYFHNGSKVVRASENASTDEDGSPVLVAADTGWHGLGGPLSRFVPTRTLWLGQKNIPNATLTLQYAFNYDTIWVDAEDLAWVGVEANPFTDHYTMPGTVRDEGCLLDSMPSGKGVTSIRAKISYSRANTNMSLTAAVFGFMQEGPLYRPGGKRTLEKT